MGLNIPSGTPEIPKIWTSCKISGLPPDKDYPDPSAICHDAQVNVQTGTPTGEPGLTIVRLPYAEPNLEALARHLQEFEGATIEWK